LNFGAICAIAPSHDNREVIHAKVKSTINRARLSLAACSRPAKIEAHHSFGAEDGDKPITLKGVITKVEWANPIVIFIWM
jgi:hypothetical protein